MSEKDREQPGIETPEQTVKRLMTELTTPQPPELKTIKVSEEVHSQLLQAKIKLKAKTISQTIKKLLERFEI